jgi:hypothetical protein
MKKNVFNISSKELSAMKMQELNAVHSITKKRVKKIQTRNFVE